MNRDQHLADGLATALLAGSWVRPQMSRRIRGALDSHAASPWVTRLVAEVSAAYRDRPGDRPRELAAFLETTAAWPEAVAAGVHVRRWTPVPTTVAHRRWPVTELADLGALGRLLDVDQGELAWFADVRGWERTCAAPLRHYTWSLVPKRRGTRLVAAPKPRLKEIQRRLLRHVLAPIPLHDAAHGAVPGRSVRTAADPHAGAGVVLRLDLASFFGSVAAGRVWGLLRLAGLPEAVAHTVTGLLTTVAPRAVSSDPLLAVPHLPQGAPTSPQVANLVAYGLDRRLAGLAARFGACYTRYVDDLVFSGGRDLRRSSDGFIRLVDRIVTDEGFRVNATKTTVIGAADRQRLLGVVVNAHPAVSRPERDRLRALVHNCVVHGWASQAAGRGRDEFRDHLLGQIAWVGSVHPPHGIRLRAVADRIDWVASR